MKWLPYTLLTALSLASADALSKKALRNADELTIIWVRVGYALPFLALTLFFVPMPRLDQTFWATVAAMVPLEIAAMALYVKAIRLSPLSLSVPFLALTPVFIIFIAFFFIGEHPSPTGVAGIIVIAAGAYMLNVNSSKEGLIGPLRAIAREPGSILMTAVALIYAFTSTLGKVAVMHSSPMFFGFFYPFILTAALTPFMAGKGTLKTVVSRPGIFLLIGLCTAMMISTHYVAISLTNVSYMIAVKRMSIIFSVIYGKLFFKEVGIRERLLGSSMMVAGVALIIAS
ncbi:MAG: DMT family transporter [Deltaproteobacteria bacterium]|nr:DMT family transporter [Deltaproteobacteria bacterium]